jgi:hypothetical protein
MAPLGVLHHLDQCDHLLIVVFRVQTRHRVGMAHKCARGRHVQRMFHTKIQLARAKALKIFALAPVDIDDLDVTARFDEIRLGGPSMNPDLGLRISQRIGQFKFNVRSDHGPRHRNRQRCGGILRLIVTGRAKDHGVGLCHLGLRRQSLRVGRPRHWLRSRGRPAQPGSRPPPRPERHSVPSPAATKMPQAGCFCWVEADPVENQATGWQHLCAGFTNGALHQRKFCLTSRINTLYGLRNETERLPVMTLHQLSGPIG